MKKENRQEPSKVKMQDRAIATRKRLLDATVQSLVEKGYAGTTTQEVCRRINVSRGTLLHHFSTREELVIQAVEHVLETNTRHFQETMARFSQDNPSLADLARALWEQHWTSGTFYAWLELVVASRTDPLLNDQVRSMGARWAEKFASAFRSILGVEPDGPYWMFFLALNALSIERLHSEPARVEQALADLMAGVEFLDRFFIRFQDRQTRLEAPASAPEGTGSGKEEKE
ncbi:MAG: TetR/AcrR family transcriptional regulator [Proteobacteria bacterium]|nr:TetR/AcrR family transcriptional regulator [Pseudomonadota bacterium]